MHIVKVNVKWGKLKFDAIECDISEPPLLFKGQVYALSGVLPERQKIMMKGVVLKDDDWNFKLRENATLMLLGSASDLPEEPKEAVKFMEDMTEQEIASALQLPPGLVNLGNTCYMNATVQSLLSIPDLREALRKYDSPQSGDVTVNVTNRMASLVRDMDKGGDKYMPLVFLMCLHQSFPHFAEKDESGTWMQQDASECWTEIMRCLKVLKANNSSSSKPLVDQIFGIELSSSMKCLESEDEPTTSSTEILYRISCYIEKEIKYLQTGLRHRLLKEKITKRSALLDRDAQFEKSSFINRLPAYLTVEMVRFFYKEREGINAKILKDIKFPLELDMYELCSDELKERLHPVRSQFKAIEDFKATKVEQKTADNDSEIVPFSFPDDPGSNNSGYYELKAVLSHKGRASNSGHYLSWVRSDDGKRWLMFDDEHVVTVQQEDVLRLSGGGDWHLAYILLYSPRKMLASDLKLAESSNAEPSPSNSA